jgi:hypothetical protein
MKTVIFHPLFSQELTDAIAYYEAQQPGLGLEYLEESKIQLIFSEFIQKRVQEFEVLFVVSSCPNFLTLYSIASLKTSKFGFWH